MFKAVKGLVAVVSLVTTALVAYTELRKAWAALKDTQPKRTTYRTSEYAAPTGAPNSGYSG